MILHSLFPINNQLSLQLCEYKIIHIFFKYFDRKISKKIINFINYEMFFKYINYRREGEEDGEGDCQESQRPCQGQNYQR